MVFILHDPRKGQRGVSGVSPPTLSGGYVVDALSTDVSANQYIVEL